MMMTNAEKEYLREKLDEIERRACGLASLMSEIARIESEEIEGAEARFHAWKDGLPEFPSRKELLLAIAVIAGYLQDGL